MITEDVKLQKADLYAIIKSKLAHCQGGLKQKVCPSKADPPRAENKITIK